MANLTNPIEETNLLSRFEDYVKATANNGLVWGSDNKPFAEFPDSELGGSAAGKQTETTPAQLDQNPISAAQVFNALLEETRRFTQVRKLRAIKTVSGNQGYTAFDQTEKANMSEAYRLAVPVTQDLQSGALIEAATIEAQLEKFRQAYLTAQDNVITRNIVVCHASCHSNCHGSRSRR